jgi:2-dehydro-3-deoxygalactonokinase
MSDELTLIDWGTTNARSYRVGADGAVLDKRDRPLGILNVTDGDFPRAFDALTRDWPSGRTLLSGMIGSRNGWVEAPYAECPASMASLAGSVIAHPDNGDIRFVPGLCTENPAGRFDVMRGEEVQVFGVLEPAGGKRLLCLPGTHSKWVSCRGDTILNFATSLTGEAFEVLRRHSILRLTMEVQGSHKLDGDSFDQGLAASGAQGGLLDQLFGVRALALSPQDQPGSMRDYLSGLLIGNEIAAMRKLFPDAGAVTVVGAPALATRYLRALKAGGIAGDSVASEDATLRGLLALSAGVGW